MHVCVCVGVCVYACILSSGKSVADRRAGEYALIACVCVCIYMYVCINSEFSEVCG